MLTLQSSITLLWILLRASRHSLGFLLDDSSIQALLEHSLNFLLVLCTLPDLIAEEVREPAHVLLLRGYYGVGTGSS